MGFIIFSILLLAINWLNVQLAFAQIHWDYCKVSAYGNNFDDFQTSGLSERFQFSVVAPPSGSDISNTVEVMNYETSENYTKNLSVGDIVLIRYDNINPINLTIESASEPLHHVFYYEGEVYRVRINYDDVPEFPPFLIAPLFMTATLLAILYRRKLYITNKTITRLTNIPILFFLSLNNQR